eukprot:3711396-Alexandrium_andersonii.AAC.1
MPVVLLPILCLPEEVEGVLHDLRPRASEDLAQLRKQGGRHELEAHLSQGLEGLLHEGEIHEAAGSQPGSGLVLSSGSLLPSLPDPLAEEQALLELENGSARQQGQCTWEAMAVPRQ